MTDTALLRNTPAFADLEDSVLTDLLAAGEARALADGERLFARGEAFHGEVYILVEGPVRIERGDGRIEHPAPGYLVGLSSYLSDAPYASTATATGAVGVLAVPTESLKELERRHEGLFDALNRLIASGLQRRSVSRPRLAGAMSQPASTVMHVPLATCPETTTLREAYEIMRGRDIGSLAVTDAEGEVVGIVTFRTLSGRLVKGEVDPERATVRDACRPPRTIPGDTPLWEAEDIQVREGIKYLIVRQEGQADGILSQTDIVHALATGEGAVRASIGAATDLEQLAGFYHRIGDIATQALETNRRARMAVRAVSAVHLAIQRRCIELTGAAMKAEAGPAPARFALLIMGSGGRKEMMLNPDQDNGIIIGEPERGNAESVGAWFEEFCERVNVNLDKVGYVLCPGDIMARNPVFRRTLTEWKDQVTRLARRPSEKAARWSNIFFDFDTLCGDQSLTQELRAHVDRELKRWPRLLQYMVEDDAEGRPPIGMFNRIITTGERGKKGTVDVKRNALRIVADAARILALQAGIDSCNTTDRINELAGQGVISQDFASTILESYDELVDILLAHQIAQHRAGQTIDKLVAPEDLTEPEREALRVALRAIKRFQDRLQDEMGSLPF